MCSLPYFTILFIEELHIQWTIHVINKNSFISMIAHKKTVTFYVLVKIEEKKFFFRVKQV